MNAIAYSSIRRQQNQKLHKELQRKLFALSLVQSLFVQKPKIFPLVVSYTICIALSENPELWTAHPDKTSFFIGRKTFHRRTDWQIIYFSAGALVLRYRLPCSQGFSTTLAIKWRNTILKRQSHSSAHVLPDSRLYQSTTIIEKNKIETTRFFT